MTFIFLKEIIFEERKTTELYGTFQIDDDQRQIVGSNSANNDNESDVSIGTESTSEGPPSDETGSPDCIKQPAPSLQRLPRSITSFEGESVQLDSYHQVRIEVEINLTPTMTSAASGPPTLTKPLDAADAKADSITREHGERNDGDDHDDDDDDDDVDDYRPVIMVNGTQLPAGPANPLQIGDEF